jgi:septal ring factor EnvC (AmiA/AmiB activator)
MISLGFGRLDARAALIAGLGFVVPTAALAQQPAKPAQSESSAKVDAVKQRDDELKALHERQQKSSEAEAEIKRQIEEIGADRRKLNQALIDTATRVREVENKTTDTEARLKPLDEQEAAIHKKLEGRRSVIGEVLAALQRIGRRPPPALIASPEDALQSVRAAMVLGAVLPEMRDQVSALAHDLSGLVAVRKKIAGERDTLNKQLASLGDERTRMSALIDQRQKQQTEREKALADERAHAVDLAKQAGTLKDLIAKLEQSLDPATRAARESARGEPRPLSALHDPGRMAPAVAFASLRGRVPIPVNGVKLKVFGDSDPIGGTEKGVSIASRAGAQVTAPADGWVVYAGPFRSYGQLLILNVGGGYHVLLAGMDRISVDLGQFVLAGEPVAVMGNSSQVAAILATGSSQPVLYVELRKDGTPVDPGPWWASGEGEKVRG